MERSCGTYGATSAKGVALALSLSLLALPTAGPAAAGVLTGNCRMGNQPAATLLVPYFKVDLGNPAGATTLVSVNNASSKPALARVVLWTDWGAPTLAFDLYLTGYDVQTMNVRDLLSGTVPATGAAQSHQGPFSAAAADFPACAAPRTALRRVDRLFLRAAHTGQTLPNAPGSCLGSGQGGPGIATGYITVDAVNRCSDTTVGKSGNTPADPLYFAHGGSGLASDENVLWGDFAYVDGKTSRAESQAAVSVVADPDFFTGGAYTFYGRYVGFDGRDDRMPLSSLYYTRFFDTGTFTGGTDLVVWRDNREASVAPAACAKGPGWAPLGEYQLVIFDEQENAAQLSESHAFPLTTQRVHVGSPALPTQVSAGWLMLDLWHQDGTHAQAWVTVLQGSGGRFSSGHDALRADDLCNFGP